jgi:regulatory subunit for Cdc7p protein kinase
LSKALEFGLKIWNVAKLDSVLDRTLYSEERNELPYVAQAAHGKPQNASLTSLLAAERVHGTSERDPTQKRHDFRYFSKNSYFVLVEDMRQELATIAAVEYPISKGKTGEERGAWPVLHCHPKARGPFIEFDEREQRRWEKQEMMLKQREKEKEKAKARYLLSIQRKRARRQEEEKKQGELRRTVSMGNLQQQDALPDVTAVDGDVTGVFESATASGFLASGPYVAASGNSVSIASTTGTTSNVGSFNGRPLPPNLRGKLQHEVLTKRRLTSLGEGEAEPSQNGPMGPPSAIPDRRKALLRKSRSTNTLRLPMRQEGNKPGFCESCRVKFEDFSHVSHILDGEYSQLTSPYDLPAHQEQTSSQICTGPGQLCPA